MKQKFKRVAKYKIYYQFRIQNNTFKIKSLMTQKRYAANI